jgi:hypothetical protein
MSQVSASASGVVPLATVVAGVDTMPASAVAVVTAAA